MSVLGERNLSSYQPRRSNQAERQVFKFTDKTVFHPGHLGFNCGDGHQFEVVVTAQDIHLVSFRYS